MFFRRLFFSFYSCLLQECIFFQKIRFLMIFKFGEYCSNVFFSREVPLLKKISDDLGFGSGELRPLLVADENTRSIAAKIAGQSGVPLCVLKSGEENKNWESVREILSAASAAGLGRDGIFIGIGGGVIGDLCGFASSIYMRGCRLVLVSTTLLGMVDASVGGKTGFDLFGVKNLVGSFYPAENVYIPLESLSTLPEREWKSGMAELIKTAVLDGDDFLDKIMQLHTGTACGASICGFYNSVKSSDTQTLRECIERAVLLKGAIVTEDLRESGKRMLLNLGHTFGHALEAAAGLGRISHGEAVAWGIARSCELGCELGITPQTRARKITELMRKFGYDLSCPHPFSGGADTLLNAMKSDKKKKSGRLVFIVPDEKSARHVVLETENEMKILENILKGGLCS